jgi:hypothetical protein
MSPDPILLSIAGQIIVAKSVENKDECADRIRKFHSTIEGAEMLRLIVRDNISGAGEVIASALLN